MNRQTFWAQRQPALQALSTSPPLFFDLPTPQSQSVGASQYARTKAVMAVDAGNLTDAATQHSLSQETVILTAWAILLRAYAGGADDDGVLGFGACLDREGAAWVVSQVEVTGERAVVGGVMREVEEREVGEVVRGGNGWEDLKGFAAGTGVEGMGGGGLGGVKTAVFVHGGRARSGEMYLP
ncbi:uncharacterized protein C8A04DRAFT_33455, partial [Dichotomopilus funicola]